MKTKRTTRERRPARRTMVELPVDLHATLRDLAETKGYKIKGLVARFVRDGIEHLGASA